MILSIIVAIAENGVIGKDGKLPWKLSADLRQFKELTIGHTVIVGRKTHESILRRLKHPLDGRRTIVVTRNKEYASECEIAHGLIEAIARTANEKEVFVIGGAKLYRESLPLAGRLYLTLVKAAPAGDTYWDILRPDFGERGWTLVHSVAHEPDSENQYPFVFMVYERLNPSYNFENTRHGDQRTVMQRLAEDNVCNFCHGHQESGELHKPVWRGVHWTVVPNRWPYKFTKLHLLAIPNRHIEFMDDLDVRESLELLQLLKWTRRRYKLEAYAVGARSGEMSQTGATVAHFHLHIIVADPDTAKIGYKRVRFAMGPKPPAPG